jgi:hypothetical protein
MLDIPGKSHPRTLRKLISALIATTLLICTVSVMAQNWPSVEKYYYWMQISAKMKPGNTDLATAIINADRHNEPIPIDIPETKSPNTVLGWTTIGKLILIEIIMPEFNQARYFIYENNSIRLIAAQELG